MSSECLPVNEAGMINLICTADGTKVKYFF